MPLHLLGKKSWNVYNADNIARVKRDEAAAAAREAELEQRLQDEDAAARIALLRGEQPPPLPAESAAEPAEDDPPRRKRELDEEKAKWDRDARKRRRRKHGEDDTERDIRVAREEKQAWEEARERLDNREKTRDKQDDAPITDHRGHISLFPDQLNAEEKQKRNRDEDSRNGQKRQEAEDGAGMRFSDAAGRGGMKNAPWYTSSSRSKPSDPQRASESAESGPLMVWGEPSKDVWGNEDPRRRAREEARAASTDPLAFMRRAQTQLKKVDAERKQWREEREEEVGGLEIRKDQRHEWRERSAERSRKHRHHRRHRHKSRSRSRSRSRKRRDDRERHSHRSHRRHSSRSRSPGSRRKRDQSHQESRH